MLVVSCHLRDRGDRNKDDDSGVGDDFERLEELFSRQTDSICSTAATA